MYRVLFFLFQAEDGIRDVAVTGVQTCALPIFEQLAELCMNSRVVSPPERTEWVFCIFGVRTRLTGRAPTLCPCGQFMYQFHVAIRAPRKPLPVLRFALRTIHSAESTTSRIPNRNDPGRNLPAFHMDQYLFRYLFLDKL